MRESSNDAEGHTNVSVSLSKKRKKELRKLQGTANRVLAAQREVAAEAAEVARAAGHQLREINREVITPEAKKKYHEYVEPYVDRAAPYVRDGYGRSKHFFDSRVIPAAGSAVGRAIGAYDATASKLGKKQILVAPAKKKSSAGAVIAAVLGVAAAIGIFVVAWKTLSAEDELWVADEAVSTPDA
jgi:ElaB/YqjD/DUF883 family membrane-anchored ribosome-binding protein